MNLSEKFVDLPSYVSAYGWAPFVIVILMSFTFSFGYINYLWKRTEKNRCSAGIATLGMTIALLAAFLIPVDVFLVSYMKNSDGSFKDWATNDTREALENTVTYTYYSIYSIIFVYSFFILPFVYFYYEEKDDDSPVNVFPRALVYTVIFILIIVALLVAGLLIPFKSAPKHNSTEWEKLEFLVDELAKNKGKDALSFVIHILTLYGMLNMIFYTGAGLASFPITSMKGFRSLREEESILSENQTGTQAKINALRSKQSRKSLSSREASSLVSLEEEESLLTRRSQLLETEKSKFYYKLEPVMRFINAVFGIIGIVFSLVLCLSLLLCNIDKLLNSLGYKMGYALKENVLPNPLDYIMVESQKVFPLDYILFFSIIIYLVICTISGMRRLCICCFCVPMYKIKPKRTAPQGLLMLSFILMFTVFAFHILMFAVIPTYATFGSQSYCAESNSTCKLQQCTLYAPTDECVMTRSATFLLSFAYKAWIFGCVYFWMTWIFIGNFILSFFLYIYWSRRSFLEEAIDKDDFDDTDDEQMIRA